MPMRFFAAFALFSFSVLGTPLAPRLSESTLQRIKMLRDTENSVKNLEAAEMKYQELVQKQTLLDLLEFYKPENKELIETTYASFTPESTHGGGDYLGFGLHVVKRLRRILPDGTEKITDINELWPEEKITGGLLLPDEIRIKTLSYEGRRHEFGSHELYLFDSVRVAWGPGNEGSEIHRRTLYSENKEKQLRVPVSAPYSCKMCHDPYAGFAADFLAPGEKQNPEAIVQDSAFKLPPEKQRGFQQYINYLKASGKNTAFISKARDALLDVKKATEVPGIRGTLENTLSLKQFSWLLDDLLVSPQTYELKTFLLRQGYYQTINGTIFRDAIEEVIEGKYRWWEPTVVIP